MPATAFSLTPTDIGDKASAVQLVMSFPNVKLMRKGELFMFYCGETVLATDLIESIPAIAGAGETVAAAAAAFMEHCIFTEAEDVEDVQTHMTRWEFTDAARKRGGQ